MRLILSLILLCPLACYPQEAPQHGTLGQMLKNARYDRFTDMSSGEVSLGNFLRRDGLPAFTAEVWFKLKGTPPKQVIDFDLVVRGEEVAKIMSESVTAYLLSDIGRTEINSTLISLDSTPPERAIKIPLSASVRNQLAKDTKKLEMRIDSIEVEFSQEQLHELKSLSAALKDVRVVNTGKLLYIPRPEYPLHLRLRKIDGIVTVKVVIDEQGAIISAKGETGNFLLFPFAEAAAMLARFEPTTVDGKPVKADGQITFRFVR